MTPEEPPRSKLAWAFRFGLQLLVTAVVTWFILRAVGFHLDQLREFDLTTLEIRWSLVALSSLVLLGAYLFSAGLWGLMVTELGKCEVPVRGALRVFFTANLGRYLPGKLWQIAGLAYLARGEGVPAATATGAAVLGQAFSLAGATLVGAGVLLGIGGAALPGQNWTALVVLALLVAATSPGILKAVLPFWFRLARQETPGGLAPGATFGIRWMGLYALGWMGQGLAFWILAQGLGFQITILQGIPAYAAAYVGGYIVLVAPAGVGIREGLLVAFLAPILGPGAGVLAVVARVWTTLVELIPAIGFAGGYMKNSLKEDGSGG